MSNLFSKNLIWISLAVMLLAVLNCDVYGQQSISREVREKFEAMLDELTPSLQRKFQAAIDNNTPIVNLTPSEFRSFRDNPANPFDINDVDPDDLDGNIELRFELPSLRNRPIRRFERQSRSLRRNLRGVVQNAAFSTTKVTDGRDQLALATIVREDGLLLTKYSEIEAADQLFVVTRNKQTYEASIAKIDNENDLALLKIDAKGLRSVNWSNVQPLGGSFVATPNQVGEVVALGSYSVVARSTVGENRGFLGIAPTTVENGVRIVQPVESDTAAYAAGLRSGDIIFRINEMPIKQVDQLVNEIRTRQAGDEINIAYFRNGNSRSTVAKLAGLNLASERAARFKMMSRLGAIPSERKAEFPVVFQHDSPLFPEQCGGPICDLDGNVLGLNIARETRASTLAIPSNHIKKILDKWLRLDVAQKNPSN